MGNRCSHPDYLLDIRGIKLSAHTEPRNEPESAANLERFARPLDLWVCGGTRCRFAEQNRREGNCLRVLLRL